MGEAINSFFNEIMLTEFDNGVIYFTGRDLIAMLI